MDIHIAQSDFGRQKGGVAQCDLRADGIRIVVTFQLRQLCRVFVSGMTECRDKVKISALRLQMSVNKA